MDIDSVSSKLTRGTELELKGDDDRAIVAYLAALSYHFSNDKLLYSTELSNILGRLSNIYHKKGINEDAVRFQILLITVLEFEELGGINKIGEEIPLSTVEIKNGEVNILGKNIGKDKMTNKKDAELFKAIEEEIQTNVRKGNELNNDSSGKRKNFWSWLSKKEKGTNHDNPQKFNITTKGEVLSIILIGSFMIVTLILLLIVIFK